MNKQIEYLYNKIFSLVKDTNLKIANTNKSLADIKAGQLVNIPARIKHLEELLEKIDDYMLRVKGFQELAKKNLSSEHVLTIEAPPGYRVNLNRLKKWALLIDPASDNDPYAQRVLAVAKCDECFLEQKRREFTKRLEALKVDKDSELTDEMSQLEQQIEKLEDYRKTIAASEDVKKLAKLVSEEHKALIGTGNPETFSNVDKCDETLALGCKAVPFNIGKISDSETETLFGEFYDAQKGLLYLPFEIPAEEEFIINISYPISQSKILDEGIQNIILNQIDKSPAGTRSIYVIDGMRFSSASISNIRQIENTFALSQIPRNPEQISALLERIVSSFADADDSLQMYDSVREYNANEEKKIPYSTLVLFGWPSAYSLHDRDMIRRIMLNYERYGFSCIIASLETGDLRIDDANLTTYIRHSAVAVNMSPNRTTVSFDDSEDEFKWYQLNREIPDSYVESIKAVSVDENTIGNVYTDRFSLEELPAYSRGYKPIVLPIGVDGKDQVQSISFDKNNFAAYLIGDSGSGKSTLIHTIIAGILREYHPDDVELWLADFKQVEFKQYIDHMPPHVKYILLDESNELVYDLIDKLNDEMFARQLLLARLGKEKVEQIDVREFGKPVPIIFVILDEFSIMSQAIEEDQSYRLKLQNLLAKGRALGFKFLFASQKFTSGVTGLTPTAKDQIQQRISMKAPKDEINEVLALSPALRTEKVRNWIDAIPPYYALVKRRVDDDTLEVSRTKVMYFSDNYESRDSFIDGINNTVKCVKTFDYDDFNSYVDKEPVIVDGNSYEAFDLQQINNHIVSIDRDEEDVLLSFGAPRLMSTVKITSLTNESRENILLVGRAAEQDCNASIITSIIKMAKNQGKGVSVWSHNKNKLFKQYSDLFASEGIRTIVGMTDICSEIKAIKESIQSGVQSNQIIVMLGMERICSDFEYNDGLSNKQSNDSTYDRSPEEEKQVRWHQYKMEIMEKRSELIRTSKEEGKSDEEIKDLVEKLVDKMKKEFEDNDPAPSVENVNNQDQKSQNTGVYNASSDFSSIVRGGSRFGYHFVLCVNSISDFKATNLKIEYFRHRIAFQLSEDDSYAVFGKKIASKLPEHTCLYDDSFYRYSLRPYLHRGICWDGWSVNEDNKSVNPMEVQLL